VRAELNGEGDDVVVPTRIIGHRGVVRAAPHELVVSVRDPAVELLVAAELDAPVHVLDAAGLPQAPDGGTA
jgi:hypothetical protein